MKGLRSPLLLRDSKSIICFSAKMAAPLQNMSSKEKWESLILELEEELESSQLELKRIVRRKNSLESAIAIFKKFKEIDEPYPGDPLPADYNRK